MSLGLEMDQEAAALSHVVGHWLSMINDTLRLQSLGSKDQSEMLATKLDNLNSNITKLTEQFTASSEQLESNFTALTRSVERVADRIETILSPEIASSSETTQEALTGLTDAVNRIENTLKTIDTTIVTKSFTPDPVIPTEEEFDIGAAIRRRNLLSEKIIRLELISNYYEELLNEATPFVQPKYRTKVPKNAPERDLKHRRQQTISNVNTEIVIMRDRVDDWNKQCAVLDSEIDNYCNSCPNEREAISDKIQNHQTKYRASYNATILKMREEDERNKNETFDYLLNVVDEDPLQSKNDRGRTHNQRNRTHQRSGRNRSRR